MSASTVVAAVPADAVRPVAWRRLGWVTWRRHRATLLGTVGLLALIGVYLLVTGLQIRSAWQTVQACTPQNSGTCQFAWQGFHDKYGDPGILGVVYIFAPLLIGAFAGAPLLGRELETGTFRYAWTQGVGRTRWTIATLVSGAVAVAVSAARSALWSPGTRARCGRPTSRHGSSPASSRRPAWPWSVGRSRRTPSAWWLACCGSVSSPPSRPPWP